MNTLPAAVMLQAQPGGFDISFFVMMGAIFLIFYFLVMRPQQKRQQEHEALLKAVVRGDEVITTGGLHGKVTEADHESVLTVEIASLKGGERVRVKIERSRIDSVIKPGGGDKA